MQAQQVAGRGRVLGPPKSKAGVRTVAVPSALTEVLDAHLANFVGPGSEALVFTGEKGAPIVRSNWARRLGDSTPRAALIYQHATAERDHQIAAGIDAILQAAKDVPVARVVRMRPPGTRPVTVPRPAVAATAGSRAGL